MIDFKIKLIVFLIFGSFKPALSQYYTIVGEGAITSFKLSNISSDVSSSFFPSFFLVVNDLLIKQKHDQDRPHNRIGIGVTFPKFSYRQGQVETSHKIGAFSVNAAIDILSFPIGSTSPLDYSDPALKIFKGFRVSGFAGRPFRLARYLAVPYT